DCIVTDHAPHHENDKNVEYNLAAFGISGIETSFAFAITYLYKTGFMTLSEIADKMSRNPAKILNLEGGELKEGGVADILLANLDKAYKVDPANFYSKGKNTPFTGYELFGTVEYTVVDGEIKYKA
ncbi:MAG: amidohydrolase family protein, partial [Clostridia bacterium]|nr:amidohydrolase family protein [Clostridia bacterium]